MRALILLGLAASAFAQEGVTANLKSLMLDYKKKVVAIAAAFPAADQNFRPTKDVMSVKELVDHITDANYALCSQLKGEAKPKAESLAASYDYCVDAIQATDGKFAEKTKTKTPRDKGWIAFHLLEHNGLHYGNLVTYLRLRGMAPPKG